jgi:hypothetical protein
VQACLDIPLHKPAYKTHPTAGLTYTARGAMPSTPTGTQSDPRTIVGAPRKGRLVRGAMDGSYTALVSGVVAKVKNVGRSRYLPDRAYPVDVYPYDGSAVIDRHGRLDLQVSLSPPSAPPTVRSHEASPHLNFRPQQTGASNRTYRVD